MPNRTLVTILLCLLLSCKGKSFSNEANKESASVPQRLQTNYNFDNNLKCSEYSYGDHYFFTADYGCIYSPEGGNQFGNLIIYLIPKKVKELSIDAVITAETKRVNTLSVENLKTEFSVFVFLIPKDFLNHSEGGDPSYYQRTPYTEQAFVYNSETGKWALYDSLEIASDAEARKEQTWREGIIAQETGKQIKEDSGTLSNTENSPLLGTYKLTTDVESIVSGDAIKLTFYFAMYDDKVNLRIGGTSQEEAFCEGDYTKKKENNFTYLEYTGEGICTDEKELRTFTLKEDAGIFFVKSGRFIRKNEWLKLEKE